MGARDVGRRLLVGLTVLALLAGCGASATPTPKAATPTPTSMPSAAATPSPSQAVAATPGLTPSPSPAANIPQARVYGAMVSLGADGGVLLLGGETAPPPPWGTGAALWDVWRYGSQGGWKPAATEPTPNPHFPGSVVYDSKADRVIVATITDSTPPIESDLFYDPKADHWQTKASPTGPLDILGAPIVYDSKADRVILFGGSTVDFTCNDQTWSYDLASNTWTRETPKVSPPAANFGNMVYDPKADRVIMYAVDCNGNYVGTWAYDLPTDNWTDLKPAVSPPSRAYGAMAYDPSVDKIILFGGVDEANSEAPRGDTWAYSLAANSWTQLSPAVAPSARGWAPMAYEAASGKLVLFGGGTDRSTPLADTWLFDAATNVWTQAVP